MLQRKLLWIGRTLVILLLLVTTGKISAQELEYCGTQGINLDWEKFLTDYQDVIVRSAGCEVYVAMTVHVLGDDNGVGYLPISTVFGSIETLNKDFEESGIKFYLSGPLNYINESKWYEHDGFGAGSQMMNANNVDNTVNCYIVQNAAGNCGYRAFNGDAIALAKSCTGTNDHTWAHEMGHWLSLPHTFFGWEGTDYDDEMDTPSTIGSRQVEKVDGSNCDQAADRICDTPVDYLSFRWGCDDNNEYPDSLKDPNGERFAVDGSLFMSYAFDACQSRFSNLQVEEMCTYLQNFVPEVLSNEDPLGEVDAGNTKLIYPIDGEIVENAVELQWEEEGNATFYIVEVSRFPNLGILSARELVYGTSLNVFGLTANKKYYWRVRAFNNYDLDYGNRTATENFSTGDLSSTVEYYAENLKIFPNPVHKGGSLSILLNSDISEDLSITLLNLDGRSILQERHFVKNGSNHIQMLTNSLASGVYILRGKGKLHNFQKKIVIE